MKRKLLSAILLFIVWAVSASAINCGDYSTAYTYDRNANITSLTRRGITDIIGLTQVSGLHSDYAMSYDCNRLTRMVVEREGSDYEGRTGVMAKGTVTGFWYDANGNLGRDPSRGIPETHYNRRNLPTDVYFENGHRQSIVYDGFGQKRSVAYLQTESAVLGTMMGVPDDSEYTLVDTRSYIGPHVFCGGDLEYSAFPGGYFTPEGTYYYIADWQGNNAAVVDATGNVVQKTHYYPYGEPTIEPIGQRYLYGGKEREHAGGYNAYDFSARWLTPFASWSSADPLATSFYPISPFSYCGGDPINHVDRDGRWIDTVVDALCLAYDLGSAAVAYSKGDTEAAKSHLVDAAVDFACALVPGVSAGVTKVAKVIKTVDKASDVGHVTKSIKTAEKTSKTSVSPKMKNSDKVAAGRNSEAEKVAEAIDRGDDVATQVTVVPLNGKGNVKYNRSSV